ncbi:type VI secretion system tube protein TssD [Asticcacaulis solisilvae]|uniref:type VI secretion system tube protein TssD n=1 Tax=Asticcacaulis solisilvae TaxID=1217274 RepID=UPI003FD89FB7
MRNRIIGLFATAAFLLAAGAHAEQGFLQIKGQKTGEIKGDAMQKGHEGWSTVRSIDYGMTAGADAAGMATGRRLHQGISFTLSWSKATPLLVAAANSSENLTDVEFQRWAPQTNAANGIGVDVNSDTIHLSNARITSLKIVDQTEDKVLDPVVIVTFSYQKMTITHVDGGITGEDSWAQ